MLKIHIRLAPDLQLRSWKAEATPLKAGKHGGTYRLAGFSPMIPIAPGDVIQAERGGDGLLWMTELVEMARATVSILTPHPSSPRDTWNQWARALAEEGGNPYISYPVILCSWTGGEREAEVLAILQRIAPDAVVSLAMGSEERREAILDSVMIDRVWLEWLPEDNQGRSAGTEGH